MVAHIQIAVTKIFNKASGKKRRQPKSINWS